MINHENLKMSEIEIAIYNMLPKGYMNPSKPIKIKKIMEVTGINERMVKQVIRGMIDRYGIPIIGVRTQPSGYFIAQNKKEVELMTAQYRSQIAKEQQRLKILMGAFE